MNHETGADQFWRDGFLHVPGFFSRQVMASLDRRIHDHFGTNPAFEHTDEFVSKSKVEVIPWFPQREGEAAFDALEQDPRLEALTQAILGVGWQTHYCMIMFSKDGSSGQAWHQDCPPDDTGVHNLNRLVYTRDIDPAHGGQIAVVPGSHREGELPVGDPVGLFSNQVVIAPKAGDLILLHGHTWHRVMPTLGGSRSSTNFRSAPQGTPDDITDICVYRNMRYQFSTSRIVLERV